MNALPWVTCTVLGIHLLALVWVSMQERPSKRPIPLQVSFFEEVQELASSATTPLALREEPEQLILEQVVEPPPPEPTPPPEPSPQQDPPPALPQKKPAEPPPDSPKKRERVVTQAPSPTKSKKGKKPLAVTRQETKPSAPKPSEPKKLNADAQAALERLRKHARTVHPTSHAVAKVAIPDLKGTHGVASPRVADALGRLTSQLQGCAILPEQGQVRMRLTVNRQGSISHLEVLHSQSTKNQRVLENALKQLSLDVSEIWDGQPLVLVVTFSHA